MTIVYRDDLHVVLILGRKKNVGKEDFFFFDVPVFPLHLTQKPFG